MDDLNACGCCEGISPQTPFEPVNRPGLSSIRRRVGNYSQFLESMLAALSSSRWLALRDLRTRQPDDFSIALLDCWAVVADVLTFYQERIANECYLGTASERRSLIELGRLTGYKLLPGAAATAWLAFTVEGAAGAPGYAKIPQGTRVQSVPGPEEVPQIYETLDSLEARAEWNAMQPRQKVPQSVPASLSVTHIILQAAPGSLRRGDSILIASAGQAVIKTIASIDLDRITLASGGLMATTVSPIGDGVWVLRSHASIFGHNAPVFKTLPAETKGALKTNGALSEWPFTEPTGESAKTITLDTSYPQIVKDGIVVATIPGTSVVVARVTDVSEVGVADYMLSGRATQILLDQPVARKSFADVRNTSLLAQSEPLTLALTQPDTSNLDAGVKSIVLDIALQQSPPPDRYAILTGTPVGASAAISEPIQIVSVQDNTLTLDFERVIQFSLSSINIPLRELLESPGVLAALAAGALEFRERLVYNPESGTLASTAFLVPTGTPMPIPVGVDISGATVLTFTMDVDLISLATGPGGPVMLTGTISQSTATPLGSPSTRTPFGNYLGVPASISLALSADNPPKIGNVIEQVGDAVVLWSGGAVGSVIVNQPPPTPGGVLTVSLRLKDGLQNSYQRSTVVINANVAAASHGETKTEVLGSGDSSRPYQTFLLSNSPVTYLADDSPKGASSTLQVRVNKVLWQETPELYGRGKRDRVYVTRIDDNYKMSVQTGDGRTGARLPSGVENVEAVYRVGLGLQGLVKAGQLKLLMTRPLGVKAVVNPLDAEGGADPEKLEDARRNIPKQVLTLDRAVSLSDFEDYARAFTGVGKALAVWFWSGLRRGVVLTVAGPRGLAVPARAISMLAKSLRQFGDRFVDLRIENYRSKVFQVKIELLIDPAYRRSDVESAVSGALSRAFSFDARQFGQPVSLSEISALVQGVAGVVAARVPILDFAGPSPGPNTVLLAETPRTGSPEAASRDHAAELLLLAPDGVTYGVLA